MLPQRFWDKVQKTSDCWIWTGAIAATGYPRYYIGKREDGAYRFGAAYRAMYEDLHGPIPRGMQLDHVCHSANPACRDGPNCLHRRCVNPDHLELVDGATNVRRAHKGNADVCKNGHPRTPENTRIRSRGAGAPARDCRICARERQRERRA